MALGLRRARGGTLGPEDVDESERRLFLYAQWELSKQLRRLRSRGVTNLQDVLRTVPGIG